MEGLLATFVLLAFVLVTSGHRAEKPPEEPKKKDPPRPPSIAWEVFLLLLMGALYLLGAMS